MTIADTIRYIMDKYADKGEQKEEYAAMELLGYAGIKPTLQVAERMLRCGTHPIVQGLKAALNASENSRKKVARNYVNYTFSLCL